MEGKEKEGRKSSVTLEEQKKMQEEMEGAGSFFAISLLGRVRDGEQDLDSVLEAALNEPGNEEHKVSWQKAAEFLKDNAKEFNLEE